MVVPERHDEDHASAHGGAHLWETALGEEAGVIAEGRFLVDAVLFCDGIVLGLHGGDLGHGVGDDLAVLDVEAADLVKLASGGVVSRQELGDDSEFAGRIDGLAGAVEGGVTLAVGVEVASVGVADRGVAGVGAVSAATIVACADLEAGRARARVGRDGSGDGVGFPDVHLRAASSVVADTGVDIAAGWLPTIRVRLSGNELQVTRALRVCMYKSDWS